MTNPDFSNFTPCPKAEPKPKKVYAGLKRTALKKKWPEPKGKREFFRSIWEKCGGLCMVTGHPFPMNSSYSYMHVLAHGPFERFEFYEKNVLFVNPRIHTLYDNVGKTKLLEEFPEAAWIFDLKEILLMEYNRLPTI